MQGDTNGLINGVDDQLSYDESVKKFELQSQENSQILCNFSTSYRISISITISAKYCFWKVLFVKIQKVLYKVLNRLIFGSFGTSKILIIETV